MGEWELLDISSYKPKIDLNDDTYIDHLDFHVGQPRLNYESIFSSCIEN